MTLAGVSVLIPTRRPGPLIAGVLRAVFDQRIDRLLEVVIVDSGSPPEDLARMRAFPVRLVSIAPAEFGHGRTRNLLAEHARHDVLVFLSQDAQPAGPDWLRTLVDALAEPGVAGAYARQIPRPGADPLTRFFLGELYGPTAQRRRLLPGSGLRLADIFFSNVSSAIRHDVWQRVQFRADAVMSEDQYWAFDALEHGYVLRYEPAAQVYHSHAYSLRTLFARNRLSGYSLHGLIADTPRAIVARGLRYVAREAAYLVRQGHARWLPYMVLAELTRSAGFAAGSLEARTDRAALHAR
jgi:rhamnosyltransferase